MMVHFSPIAYRTIAFFNKEKKKNTRRKVEKYALKIHNILVFYRKASSANSFYNSRNIKMKAHSQYLLICEQVEM